MKPEAQRIAIAEAGGFFFISGVWYFPNGAKLSADGVAELPDYLKDLNAMHAAEKGLFDYQWGDYIDWLSAVLGVKAYDSMEIMHATAAQRAEAFLRAIGKWEEGK